MTVTPGLLAALTFSAMLTVFRCDAEQQLPPPTNLSYVWINEFAVKISWNWEKPKSLESSHCKIKFKLVVKDQPHPDPTKTKVMELREYVAQCITANTDSDHCTITVHAMFDKNSCEGWSPSTNVSETARRKEPRVELVKEFKCLIEQKGMNCSWIPVTSQNLQLSYRACVSDPQKGSLTACGQPYSTGTRNGCYWQDAGIGICIYIESEIGWSFFQPTIGTASPVLTIREDNNLLKYSWSPPEIPNSCIWIYELCYKECENPEQCRAQTYELTDQNDTPQNEMLYNRDCRYEFRTRLNTSRNCPESFSDWSEIVTHGTTKTPDRALPLVAIIIPIILFFCILLACYCFRRHSDIICPNIPDPSAIFKEMWNGNKEHNKAEPKPIENVYTPMPEAVDSCKVTLISQSGALQSNS